MLYYKLIFQNIGFKKNEDNDENNATQTINKNH